MKPRVYITRRIPEVGVKLLRECCEVEYRDEVPPPAREELLEAVGDVDAIYCTLNEKIDRSVLDKAERLKVVGTMSVGVDHIDVEYATSKGVYVVHTPGVLTETVADHAWALLLSAARRVVEADGFVRRGEWEIPWAPTMMLGHDLHGKVLGIIGLGRIGAAVARRKKHRYRVFMYGCALDFTGGAQHFTREREQRYHISPGASAGSCRRDYRSNIAVCAADKLA